MRVLKIGKEEYKFQFDIEASLYSECTEKVTSIMFAMAGEEGKDAKKAFLSSLSDIPQVALHMFHAGLLENHDVTLSDSKELLKEYIKEHKEDETGSFYGVMNMLLELCKNNNTALLLITHNPDFAKITDREVLLSHGEILEVR
jgi:hypothetical protein